MVTKGKIKAEKVDAPEFIEMVNTIMGSFIFQYGIKEIVYVKINNWFDRKWLNYSGKTLVYFEFSNLIEGKDNVALQNEWREKVSIPPFHPKRVIYSRFFQKEETGNQNIRKRIHRLRRSHDNIHNRVENYTSDGLIVWFSSNTKLNQKGSLMMYRVQDDEVHTWYATVENKDGWDITRTKGIELNELKGYIK